MQTTNADLSARNFSGMRSEGLLLLPWGSGGVALFAGRFLGASLEMCRNAVNGEGDTS